MSYDDEVHEAVERSGGTIAADALDVIPPLTLKTEDDRFVKMERVPFDEVAGLDLRGYDETVYRLKDGQDNYGICCKVSLTEEGKDPVLDGIVASLEQDGTVARVLSYVVVARLMDEEGNVVPWMDDAEGQDRATTLGLLDSGTVRAQDLLRREWREAEEA